MKIRRYYLNEIVVFFCLFLITTNFILYRCIDNWAYKDFIRILSILCLLANLFTCRVLIIKKIELIFISYIILGIIISFNNYLNVACIYLVVLNMYQFSSQKKIRKGFMIIAILNIVLVCALLLTGLSNNEIINLFNRTRYTFGFSNVNSLGVVFIPLIFFININAKNNIMKYLTMITVYVFYKYTDSRTPMIMFTIYIILLTLYKFSFFNRGIKILVRWLLPVTFFLSYFSIFINRWFPIIDIILSYRLSIYEGFIRNNIVNFVIGFSKSIFIDNSFLILGSLFGVIGLIYIMIVSKKIIINMFEKKQYNQALLIASYLLACMMESYLILPEMLLSIYFWYLILDNIRSKERRISKKNENCINSF